MATNVSMGSLRPPFLTRSWVLTPSYLFHQIPHQNIPRSSEPYRMRNAYPDRPTPLPNAVNKPKRCFHTSRRCRSTEKPSPGSKIPHISVHIAAASSAKGMKYIPEKSTYDYTRTHPPHALGLQDPTHSIYQKRRARPPSGQDAYFVAAVGKDVGQNTTAFGVCDGVGGWADHGVDPADFSHGLSSYMAKTALEWPTATSRPDGKLAPQRLLELAYDKVVRDPEVKAGGSTACVGVVEDDGRMRIANLGDSGFVQLRLGTAYSYSEPQTHAFNTPYQMSLTPPEMLAQAMIFGGLPLNDHPERADVVDHMLQHGDVVVLATDGVWDNLSSQDILTSVSDKMRNVGAWERTKDRGYVAMDVLSGLVTKESALKAGLSGTLQSVLAAAIVGEAKSASLNRKRDGPFAKAWKLNSPYDPYHGGKVDDITAVVIVAVENGRQGEHAEASSQDMLKAKL